MLSRNTFRDPLKQFEKLMDMDDEQAAQFKKRKKAMREDAVFLKEMMETQGWKRIFGPFLKSAGHPDKLFRPEVRNDLYLRGKVEAFYKLRTLLNNYLRLLEEEEEPEDQEAEDQEEAGSEEEERTTS